MMSRPRLLLLDEPSMGLAPVMVERTFEAIENIRKGGTTILLVEQNARMALNIATRGYVLQTGKIVLVGTARELMNNDRVRQTYLGLGVRK
jgi:branched-chain amino acid transport system ATP-binding protein